MKQEELKLLAEWYGYKTTPIKDGRKIAWYLVEDMGIKNEHKRRIHWMPDKDSNQLDMLEDKMVSEFVEKYSPHKGHIKSEISYFGKKVKCGILFVGDGDLGTWGKYAEGLGKTKNEARLNAILNYVRKK